MKNCEIVKDLLPLYLDDVCSQESRELVEDHLAKCEQCQKEAKNMKTTYLLEESFIEDNKKEEQLLKAGKKNIEEKVKKDYLEKATMIDLFVNVIIAVGLLLSIYINAWEESILEISVVFVLCVVPITVSVWEVLFIIKNKKGKDSPVGHMIAMSSICLKIGACVMALLAGVTIAINTFFS